MGVLLLSADTGFRRVARYSPLCGWTCVFSAMEQRSREAFASRTIPLAFHVCGDNMFMTTGGGEPV